MSVSTRIYGASDDLLEFEGEVEGEVGAYDVERLIVCSDGSVLTAEYGKGPLGIWKLTVINRGSCFIGLKECLDEDADIDSDVAEFGSGLRWAIVASDWTRVE